MVVSHRHLLCERGWAFLEWHFVSHFTCLYIYLIYFVPNKRILTSMASFSLSSDSTLTSSQSWSYDVFLNFRGEDIRRTFVDHLYSALVDRLIRTYKDNEELHRGDTISSSLFDAIRGSKIALIIFSKNYADSSWCLDELAYIMECRRERGLISIPIFYHVDASDVRQQKGDFGKAFSKQEMKNPMKVESWRKVLVNASNIAGWEPKYIANGNWRRAW
ncbi:putative TIR domain-containing protein [Helianthus annuus]|nr:putative TIR domain-containing protein [Helianthus annuus]